MTAVNLNLQRLCTDACSSLERLQEGCGSSGDKACVGFFTLCDPENIRAVMVD